MKLSLKGILVFCFLTTLTILNLTTAKAGEACNKKAVCVVQYHPESCASWVNGDCTATYNEYYSLEKDGTTIKTYTSEKSANSDAKKLENKGYCIRL